ncbi:MAG: hypothetical protein AAB215_01915 [Planctomycetota bacterium]
MKTLAAAAASALLSAAFVAAALAPAPSAPGDAVRNLRARRYLDASGVSDALAASVRSILKAQLEARRDLSPGQRARVAASIDARAAAFLAERLAAEWAPFVEASALEEALSVLETKKGRRLETALSASVRIIAERQEAWCRELAKAALEEALPGEAAALESKRARAKALLILKFLVVAQEAHRDRTGAYAALEDLSALPDASLLKEAIDRPWEYRVTFERGHPANPAWRARLSPADASRRDLPGYFADSSGIIRSRTGGEASSTDFPVE